MIAKKIIRRDGKTIRMNLATCKTFNADFDGDLISFGPKQVDATKVAHYTLVDKHCKNEPRYNYLVPTNVGARQPNCGNLLRALTTTYLWETVNNIQGNDLGHRTLSASHSDVCNNVRDWTIRIELLRVFLPMESVQRLI